MINPCSFCKASCCKSYIITATPFDLIRISKSTKKDPIEFAELHQARLLNYDPDATLDMTDDPWIYLLGIKSHPCVFLAQGHKCAIHHVAPLSCKRYPHNLEGKLNRRFCPLSSQLIFGVKGPHIDTKKLVKEINLYKKIVKLWNKKKGKKSDCIEFLIKKAKAMR